MRTKSNNTTKYTINKNILLKDFRLINLASIGAIILMAILIIYQVNKLNTGWLIWSIIDFGILCWNVFLLKRSLLSERDARVFKEEQIQKIIQTRNTKKRQELIKNFVYKK